MSKLTRLMVAVGTATAITLAFADAPKGYAHEPGVSLSGLGSATIDGVLSPGEWDSAGTVGFDVNVPVGNPVPGTLFVMNDEINLYLAVEIAATEATNSASFNFDNDHSGDSLQTGDNSIIFNPAVGFFDLHARLLSPSSFSLGLLDTDFGGTSDGDGALSIDGGFTVYEFSLPLDSADDLFDFSLGVGDTVGFNLTLQTGTTIDDITRFPSDLFGFPPSSSMYGDIEIAEPFVQVAVDIKPGSFPNSINPRSKSVIPVAILTTDTFDATTVDPLSVEFGPNGAMEVHERGHIEDVDGDSDLDLVLHFATHDTGIVCGDTSASLTGEIFDGQAIEGSDAIRTVGCRSMPWLELLLLDD